MTEEWRDVPNYEGLYQVSNEGQVKSLARKVGHKGKNGRRVRERLLKWAWLGRKGFSYTVVNLSKKSKAVLFLIHRLVLTAFVGPCLAGMEACHNNGIKYDNRLTNLRWDTPKGNASDDILNGTRDNIRGENHYRALLTKKEVLHIRALYSTRKYTQKKLAAMFNVNFVTMHKIVRRKSWTYI